METGGDKEKNANYQSADTTNRRNEAVSGGPVQVCPMPIDDNEDPEERKAQGQADQTHRSPYLRKRLSMEQPFGCFVFWPSALSEPEIGTNIHKSFFSFNNTTNEQADFGHQNDGHLCLQPSRQLSPI